MQMHTKKGIPELRGQILPLLAYLGLWACGPDATQTVFPTRKTLTESVYASGYVRAKEQYEAFALATGPIQALFVSEGDTVHIGTPLLQIFNEQERLRRENAEISQYFAAPKATQTRLRELELAIELAKSTSANDSLLLLRQRHLWAQGIGTAIELEQRELKFKSSSLAYQSARLNYQDLKRELEFTSQTASKNLAISKSLETSTILKSKIEGIVYALPKLVGEMATPQTTLAILGRAGEFILELQVDEYDIVTIQKGQRVLVTLDSFKGSVFEATVVKIHPIMDAKSKTFTVEAEFAKTPPGLFPNLSLEANILIQVHPNALVIPRNLLWGQNQVITEDRDTLTVVLGIQTYEFVEIIGGITEKTGLIPPKK
jgi:multidrug efflux pump subunit AcrA (membrane-fusion protein)